MIGFAARSLFTGYGWSFIRHVALPHPLKTLRAIRLAQRATSAADGAVSTNSATGNTEKPDGRITGVGFCLKPAENRCPSKGDLHGCNYLENNFPKRTNKLPAPCKDCYIREIGAAALQSGGAFYVMTSAKDILFDVFKPAMDQGVFRHGRFLLCRYSFQPFLVGLYASGIDGTLYPFCSGDCRDYKTWLKADRGIKDEQTSIAAETQAKLAEQIESETDHTGTVVRVERRGNIYYPAFE
ncbi:MAG: hypothetical protein R2912_03110 [Eubacteriales bacterium]